MAETSLSIEEREMFLGMLAHDIRQPLFLIKLHAQQAMSNPLQVEIQKHLTKIIAACQRMDRMTTDLLEYARTHTKGDVPLRKEEMCVHAIFHEVMDELYVLSPEVKVELKLKGDGIGVWDRERLHQIMANLVHNAAKYGQGTIRINSYSQDNTTHCIEVFNEGPPIPHEKLNDIFKPYTTGLRDGDSRGTGLGLYITKYLVEVHGGTITVASDEKGTTFKVCLPVRPNLR